MAPRANRHICGQCANKAYPNPDDLSAHMVREHNHPAPACSRQGCNKTFSGPRALKRHIKAIHDGEAFSCGVCSFVCNRRENLTRHERTHGQTGHADHAEVVPAAPPSPPAEATNQEFDFSLLDFPFALPAAPGLVTGPITPPLSPPDSEESASFDPFKEWCNEECYE